MNDNSKNNKNLSNSESVMRRTGAQKKDDKFVLNIGSDNSHKVSGKENRPVKNGEIYFANYQKNRSQTAAKIYASSYDDTKSASLKSDTQKAKVSGDKMLKLDSNNEDSTRLFDNSGIVSGNNSRSRYEKAMPRKAEVKKTVKQENHIASERKNSIERHRNVSSVKNEKEKSKNSNPKKYKDVSENIRTKSNAMLEKKLDAKEQRRYKRAIRRSRPNYLKRLLISVISIVLVTALLSAIGIGCINDVLAINGTEEEVSVTIPENASTSQIIKILKKSDLIHSKMFCKAFTTFRGYANSKYESGVYYLNTKMGIEGMLDEIKGNTQFTKENLVSLMFPEGWTVQQIMDKLVKNEVIGDNQKFINALKFDYNYDFIEKNNSVVTELEGFLFPDTYDFYMGESASSIIRKFLANFEEKWKVEYQQRADQLGMSAKEIITIASIIQKEAANSEQMAGVSAVIHNRLKRSVDYPFLQCDSTKNYSQKYINELVGDSNIAKYDKYYNTAVKTGLPSGPICNPGKDAIVAALYPDEENNALYFNHDDNGKIYYASDDSEFARNLQEAERINSELGAQYY